MDSMEWETFFTSTSLSQPWRQTSWKSWASLKFKGWIFEFHVGFLGCRFRLNFGLGCVLVGAILQIRPWDSSSLNHHFGQYVYYFPTASSKSRLLIGLQVVFFIVSDPWGVSDLAQIEVGTSTKEVSSDWLLVWAMCQYIRNHNLDTYMCIYDIILSYHM